MEPDGHAGSRQNGADRINGRLRVSSRSVSVTRPQALRSGIVLYGQVLASDGRSWYTVKKKRTGTARFTYACTCLGSFLGEHPLCRHIAIFKLVESQRVVVLGANEG